MTFANIEFDAKLDAVRQIMAAEYTNRRDPDIDRARGRAAAQAFRDAGGNAIDAACRAIEVAFDDTAVYRRRKRVAETFIKLGPAHAEIRGRFGKFARHCQYRNLDLCGAIIMAERTGRQAEPEFRLSREGRLVLRWLRRRWANCPWTTFVAMASEPICHRVVTFLDAAE